MFPAPVYAPWFRQVPKSIFVPSAHMLFTEAMEMKLKVYRCVLLAALAAGAVFTCVMSAVRLLRRQSAAAPIEPPATVVIDAGHGGEDGGAISVSGIKESMLNLEISLRLDDLLELCGLPTVLVRQSDISVYDASASSISEKKVSDLRNRVRLVNETEDALLVSIHQNHFSDGRYAGAQVFYSPTEGSKALAEQTQRILIDAIDPKNHRQAKPAETVYLMNNIHCPGILVECGFLSNEAEDLRLQDAGYQKKLALAISCALTRWLEEEDMTSEV